MASINNPLSYRIDHVCFHKNRVVCPLPTLPHPLFSSIPNHSQHSLPFIPILPFPSVHLWKLEADTAHKIETAEVDRIVKWSRVVCSTVNSTVFTVTVQITAAYSHHWEVRGHHLGTAPQLRLTAGIRTVKVARNALQVAPSWSRPM